MNLIKEVSNKNYIISIGQIVLLFLYFLSFMEYALGFYSLDKSLTNLYLVQMFICLFISSYKAYKVLGTLHIFTLMHLMLVVFAFGSVIASTFSPLYDFREALTPSYFKFPEQTVQQITLIYTIYICSLYVFFWIFFSHKKVYKYKSFSLPTDFRYLDTAKKMMYIAFPFEMLYSIKMFIYATSDIGRLLIYQASGSGLDIPIYLRIANIIFTSGYFLLIASSPQKKDFIRFSLLYYIPLIPTLLSGERGAAIVPILFVIWYLYRNYGVKFRLGKLVAYATVIIVVSFILVLRRTGEEVAGLSVSSLLFGFLDSSASGYKILGFYINFKNDMLPHPYPFVIDSFVASLLGVSGQSIETLQHRASIGHHLVYAINPDYYLAGGSFGTSYITECYEFGIVGVILGALVLVMLLTFFDTKMRKMRFFSIFTVSFFTCFVMSARASLFIGAMDFVKYSIIVFFSLKLYDILHKRKRSEKVVETHQV